jgi:hypothetical protein
MYRWPWPAALAAALMSLFGCAEDAQRGAANAAGSPRDPTNASAGAGGVAAAAGSGEAARARVGGGSGPFGSSGSGTISGGAGNADAGAAAAGDGGRSTAGDPAESDAGAGEGAADEPIARCVGGPAPPTSWQEHWFEHDQALTRVFHDDCVAIYFDSDVDRDEAEWLFSYVSRIWEYSLATYGAMGEERLFAIFHQGRYGGGHPSYWYDASHDNRNVADQGGNDWSEGNYDLVSHEIGHVVESTAPYPRRTSPAFGLWGDSKWAEFYQYDVYVALGMTEHAADVLERFSNASESFPRPGTRWFRDWFYPLWRDQGGAQVMVNFFRLLHDHYDGGAMNWGEYVHFMSGAAGTDLVALATTAFGWPDEWQQQYERARADFPEVVY